MKLNRWNKTIQASADCHRAESFFKQLGAHLESWEPGENADEAARILGALFSGSAVLSRFLVTHPELIHLLSPANLKHPRRKQGLEKELASWLPALIEKTDFAAGYRLLREFKQREMLRIAARDLARLGAVPEITRELSDLADVCLNGAWEIGMAQMKTKYGQPYQQSPDGNWLPAHGCVLGMGKLGGQELNYSSDVDLMFLYSDEGGVFRTPPPLGKSPKPVLTNHQFFLKLAENFITECTRMAEEGALFRIDMRLRPEGDAGPLSRSLPSYENYYAQWGQTWERMMLIKTRGVAGELSLAAEFLEMIHPFRYPRSTNQGALQEIAAMKDRIEAEVVKAGELDRNVKLGRGGIREVEFVAQALQLLHAGRQPFLQGSQTLPVLNKLAQYQLLLPKDAHTLAAGYCFLRDVEHRLQMEENRQTHSIPDNKNAQDRLARLMGFQNAAGFERQRSAHSTGIRRIFDGLLKGKPDVEGGVSDFPREFDGAEQKWLLVLEEHGFRDPQKAVKMLREFVEGPGYVHVSPRTRDLAFKLLPRLLSQCPGKNSKNRVVSSVEELRTTNAPLSDPDRVVTRLDSFIVAYGARSTLFELWNSNATIFELLIQLFDRSEFLAELAIRTPDLVDELVASGRLRQRKTSVETLKDLRYGLQDKDQHLWMRRYHQVELMRIGLRDILGLADEEQYLTELSALADACLQYALEVVTRRAKLKSPPFAVIGLGKLGGSEIDYGSDLDIIFVAEKPSAKLSRLAVELMELVSARTEMGALFQTDARLRPDGEKGVLVNSLKAYEEYYRNRAALWEIQTLTRTRVVAGDIATGNRFQELVAELTDFHSPAKPPAAWTADWKQKIHAMRLRIEKERTPKGKEELAIKTGSGGLIDAEFIAQAVCLENRWQQANTLRALQTGAESGMIPDAPALIESYHKLRRVEGILRRWSYEGEVVLPEDPAAYRRVSIRCGFKTPEAFRSAVETWRNALRQAYLKFFTLS